MFFLMMYLMGVFCALGVGLLAGWSDFKGMTIPNLLVLLVGAGFLVSFGAVWLGGVTEVFPGSFSSHLLAGGITLVISFVLFMLKVIGGGDSKFVTAYALWVGLKGLPVFLFYMAVMGAFLGLVALGLKKWKPIKDPDSKSWIGRVQSGESAVPYGIPIVVGAFLAFIKLGFVTPATLSLFLMSN